MQIVIEIPDKIKETIDSGQGERVHNIPLWLCYSIANGTPLPKGHGRLIDADKAIREENSKLVDFETTNVRDRSYCRYARIILNDAPTIIEADKAESEDKE